METEVFLSTPSARRATRHLKAERVHLCHFYPRPPRGGRLAEYPNGGKDVEFLSTPSARRATWTGTKRLGRRRNFYPRPPRGGRQQKRRKTSPLLFHYKTICTDLEELVQKHPKKQLRSAQNGLKTWCEGDGKGVSAFHSHRGEQARRSARLRIQTGDAPRCARPWSYSCCPVDKTADCPDRGR